MLGRKEARPLAGHFLWEGWWAHAGEESGHVGKSLSLSHLHPTVEKGGTRPERNLGESSSSPLPLVSLHPCEDFLSLPGWWGWGQEGALDGTGASGCAEGKAVLWGL